MNSGSTSIQERPLIPHRFVESWGRSSGAAGRLASPETVVEIKELFAYSAAASLTVAFRGTGNSYGDAAYNSEGIVLTTERMNRILSWDAGSGVIKVEPGVTISQLWQHTLPAGWWPAVVPGTMKPTVGGCLAMNVHGKNAWKVGPIGEHVLEFEFLSPDGRQHHCTRDDSPELFHAAIGGLGMLGCFTSITLQLSRVPSGQVEVLATRSRNLAEMFAQFEDQLPEFDYLVGWIDGFATGSNLGRGQIHSAGHVEMEPEAAQHSLQLKQQHLPDRIMGVVPKSLTWRAMRPLTNNLGMRMINLAKYWSSALENGRRYRQPHAAFHFLLDYVPDWKLAFGDGGLIQFQSLVPSGAALDTFQKLIATTQRHRLPSYLLVLKRHRPDGFLLSHSLEGFSLAMDFRVTEKNRAALAVMTEELEAIVLEGQGRFYFAKDSTLHPQSVRCFLGEQAIQEFVALKNALDPEHRLQSNLWRRLFSS